MAKTIFGISGEEAPSRLHTLQIMVGSNYKLLREKVQNEIRKSVSLHISLRKWLDPSLKLVSRSCDYRPTMVSNFRCARVLNLHCLSLDRERVLLVTRSTFLVKSTAS